MHRHVLLVRRWRAAFVGAGIASVITNLSMIVVALEMRDGAQSVPIESIIWSVHRQ